MAGNYVLIGGTAASLELESAGLAFRATKDLDIVLCIEVMNAEFAGRIWSFVEGGEYERRETSSGHPVLYRFQKPANDDYPAMIELFSRAPDGLDLMEGSHLSPIPMDEEASSLSAILLDDDYYRFVLEHRREVEGLSWANAACLIPLKARAWLDLTARRANGDGVDMKVIKKHRSDVLRLSQLLDPERSVRIASKIHGDLSEFLAALSRDSSVDTRALGLLIGRDEAVSRIQAAYVSAAAA